MIGRARCSPLRGRPQRIRAPHRRGARIVVAAAVLGVLAVPVASGALASGTTIHAGTPPNVSGNPTVVNVSTGNFPASITGDCDISEIIALPQPCVAPIIFVMHPAAGRWFATTGR